MSYVFVPFRQWHMQLLIDTGLPAGGLVAPDIETARAMEQDPNIMTLLSDGMPVAAGGTLTLWPGRHMAWALLPPTSGEHMLTITRKAMELVRIPLGRVEMTVLRSFDLGHRWAKMLGFSVETPVMRRYGPNGEDFTGYVMLNGG